MTADPPADGTITRVELTCHRLRALRSFYGEHLGLPVRGDSHALHVSAGSTEVVFRPAAEEADGRYHLAFEVPESLVQEAADWLAFRAPLLRCEGQVVIPSSQAWQAHSCYAFDPAGNSIELIGRHRLPDPTVRPFGPQHIRRVSEVGVVVQDVGAFVARLAKRCGIAVFGRKSPEITFCGSELGMLVVVRDGRLWFPAGPLAEASPLAVHFQGPASASLRVPSRALRVSVGPAPPVLA